LFDNTLTIHNKTWKLYDEFKEYQNKEKQSISLRRIILQNIKTDKFLSMVTTDNTTDKSDIARVMFGRWGSNENSFKYMGTRTNMHYNPVREIAKTSENQEISNPAHKKAHKELQTKKKELKKVKQKLGESPVSSNKDGKLRKNIHRNNLQSKVTEIKQEIEVKTKELENIPERVDIKDVNGKEFKVIDNEGINLWSLCETVFWNSRKELIERFFQFLPDYRDTIPVFEALIKSPGRIKSTKESILISMQTLETPRYKSAQIQLFRYMNNLKIKINGKLLLFGWKIP
jgi:hypothetical protein